MPIIEEVSGDETQALILSPTRELAKQISAEIDNASGDIVETVTIYVGVSYEPQIKGAKTANIVVGTPGRVLDLLKDCKLEVGNRDCLVLDEADRMLDMGFINDMRYIMERMPSKRHTLFFSATLSRDIEKLIGAFLSDPVHVSVKQGDTARNVQQDVVRIKRGDEKLDVLVRHLADAAYQKVLIFGRTKHGVEKLSKLISRAGVNAASIHGNKTQSQRKRALDAFRQGKIQALVATDVAARGLDISNVSHVINYDVPESYDDYVHRIGRTGRAGAEGRALAFCSHKERAHLKDIERLLGRRVPVITGHPYAG
jgi:superfamily II DNA/RNA helicase